MKHSFKESKKDTATSIKSKTYFLYILLGVIVLFGAWLRVSGILTNSFAFTYDVGRDMLAVGQIVHHHKIPLIGPTTGFAGVFYGPWWYYLLVIPYILSAGNPSGIAFFIALSGIATIIAGYVFGRKIDKEFLGFAIALIITFSSSLIGISSQIWNPNLAPFFVMIVFIILFKMKFSQNKNYILSLLLGFLLGLLIDLEIFFGILFFIGIFLSIIFFLKMKKNQYFFLTCGFAITLIPRVLFEVRHEFLMTHNLFSLFLSSSSGKVFSFGLKTDHIVTFFNLWKDTIASGNFIVSVLFLMVMIMSFGLFFKKMNKSEMFIVNTSTITFLVFFVAIVFFSKDTWSHFIVGVPILFIISFAISIHLLWRNVRNTFFMLFLLLAFIAVTIKPQALIASFQKPTWEGDAAVYRNQLAVIDYVYKQAKGSRFNEIVYTPPVHDYTYQYLFAWYGKKKYNYTPSAAKQSLFFLILEPDYENPQRLTDWLTVRKGDGKITKDEKVAGGIKVQTRTH